MVNCVVAVPKSILWEKNVKITRIWRINGDNFINIQESRFSDIVTAYETEYCYTVKGVNAAGEGAGVSTCATTNNNLAPTADAGQNLDIQVTNDGDINTDEVSVTLNGSGFDPEGSNI